MENWSILEYTTSAENKREIKAIKIIDPWIKQNQMWVQKMELHGGISNLLYIWMIWNW
jgi:hypothetical protein